MNTLLESARSGASVLVSETGVERLQLVARAGTSTTLVGGPREAGQMSSGPSPYELLGIALATCSAMTVRLYAERANIPLERIQASVAYKKAGANGEPTRFAQILKFEGDLDDHQRAKLLDVARYCPVGKLLGHGAEMTTELFDASSPGPEVATSTEASTAFKYMDDIYDLAMMMLKTGNY